MNYRQKIIALRKAANMTQAELGEKLNVTSQAVSKWENGISEPDLETINKICELFNVSPNEFFGAEETKAEEPPSVRVAPKIINGYCERCNKPVGPGEYKVYSHYSWGNSRLQEIVCNDCVKKQESREREDACKVQKFKEAERLKKRHDERIKIILCCSAFIAFVLIFIMAFASQGEIAEIIGVATIIAYGVFATILQLVWNNSGVDELLSFFCKSFDMPGIIFEFSIDGFIWAICVKIFLAILSVILSVLLFFVGLLITAFYAMVSLPFSLIGKIIELRKS